MKDVLPALIDLWELAWEPINFVIDNYTCLNNDQEQTYCNKVIQRCWSSAWSSVFRWFQELLRRCHSLSIELHEHGVSRVWWFLGRPSWEIFVAFSRWVFVGWVEWQAQLLPFSDFQPGYTSSVVHTTQDCCTSWVACACSINFEQWSETVYWPLVRWYLGLHNIHTIVRCMPAMLAPLLTDNMTERVLTVELRIVRDAFPVIANYAKLDFMCSWRCTGGTL